MDTRLYHYQYRRPRFTNPTYSSFNVSSSMTFFMNPRDLSPNNIPQPTNRYQYPKPPQKNNQYQNIYSPVQYNKNNPQHIAKELHSQLSNQGNNSLAFNQRQIYDQQNSKYNIVNLKPKAVPDHIKQFPRLTLEDKDENYYKRMQKIRQIEKNFQQKTQRNGSLPLRYNNAAGKQTFVPEEGKNPNYYQHSKYFTPKMLNLADQVGNIL